MRRWSVVAALAACVFGLGVGRANAEAKRLLGTVRVTGPVEAALPGESLRPLTGGAVVDGMQIQTGAGGVAVIQLSDGDVLGLAESSKLELPATGGDRVRLLEGRLALRLRSESALAVDAATATIRPPSVNPVALAQREALVTLTEGSVEVRPYVGTFELASADGTVTPVAAGQQATLAAQANTPVVVAAAGSPTLKPEAAAAGTAAAGGGVLAGLGISNSTAAIVGGTVAVVGGSLGGAAAAGAFSGSSGDSSGGGGAQGSPFRP